MFFFIKISISCYDEVGNELGKAEDTVDNAGINEKWEFKAAFIGTKLERCDVDNSIRTLKK